MDHGHFIVCICPRCMAIPICLFMLAFTLGGIGDKLCAKALFIKICDSMDHNDALDFAIVNSIRGDLLFA